MRSYNDKTAQLLRSEKQVQRSNFSASYTLVEMLTVLAIVSLLAAILLPVYLSARRRSHESTCSSNLEQIGGALAMYVSDYDHRYPSITPGEYNLDKSADQTSWRELVAGYLGGLMPPCPDADANGILKYIHQNLERTGYAFNARLNSRVQTGPTSYYEVGRLDSEISHPGLTVSIFDCRVGIDGTAAPDERVADLDTLPGSTYIPQAVNDILTEVPGSVRHHGGAFYNFVDGHLRWLEPSQIDASPRGDGVRPGFGRF